MKRVIGFALLCIALGIVVTILLQNMIIKLLILLICALVGYNLFSCE